MPCIRCGGNFKIEKHHVIHKIYGGIDIPENLVDLCRHCHKYQHAKENLLNALIGYINGLRNVTRPMKLKYVKSHIELTIARLEYLESENTPIQIATRGYYPYWNNKDLHIVKKG